MVLLLFPVRRDLPAAARLGVVCWSYLFIGERLANHEMTYGMAGCRVWMVNRRVFPGVGRFWVVKSVLRKPRKRLKDYSPTMGDS